MIWPAWIALACIAVVVSWRRDPRPALAILAGLICIRIAGYAIPAPFYLWAGAALWVGIGGLIVTRFSAPASGALVVLSALCYPLARVLDAPVGIGSPVFVASDVLGGLALVASVTGGGYGRRVVDYRSWVLGRYRHRRRAGAMAGAQLAETEGGR